MKVNKDLLVCVLVLGGGIFSLSAASNVNAESVNGYVNSNVSTNIDDTHSFKGNIATSNLLAKVNNGVDLSAANFPDEKFRASLKSFDVDKDGVLSASEITAVQTLNLTGITDLKGVKLLTSLTNLSVNNSSLSTIDISGMLSMQNIVYASNPNLTKLDLRDCPNLVSANHSINNETVLISAGMTKYVACSAIHEHTGNIIIDLRGVGIVNHDGSKTVDLSKIISPELIKVFEEQNQPGYDTKTKLLTIPANKTSSEYIAGIDQNRENTKWTFYTDYDNPVEKGGDVTVKYVDENGKEIAKSEVKSGNVGDSYNTKQQLIDGYTFKEVQGSANGTFTAKGQSVIYVYTKNSTPIEKGGDVTVKYVDENGKEIAKSEVKSGNVGDSYTTEQKNFSDYSFKEVQGNKIGIFTGSKQVVVYVYQLNNKSENHSSEQKNIQNDRDKGQNLPITGMQSGIMLGIVGGILVLLGIGSFVKNKIK